MSNEQQARMDEVAQWGREDGANDARSNRPAKKCRLASRGEQFIYDCAYLGAYEDTVARFMGIDRCMDRAAFRAVPALRGETK